MCEPEYGLRRGDGVIACGDGRPVVSATIVGNGSWRRTTKIYDSEINVRISWLWDGGIEVRLGDEMNGFPVEETVASVAAVLGFLQEAIAHFYPDSTYARSLAAEVRSRASQRIFRLPTTGLSVRCPKCKAPNAATPGIEVVIQFVCIHCGESVSVAARKVQ